MFSYVKIEIFVPEDYIETLRDELHKIGVGKVGQYDHCLSITDVRGYWRPLSEASPHAGIMGEINFGHECKVEISCRYDIVKNAITVISDIHPYEKPLINIVPLLNHHFEELEL